MGFFSAKVKAAALQRAPASAMAVGKHAMRPGQGGVHALRQCMRRAGEIALGMVVAGWALAAATVQAEVVKISLPERSPAPYMVEMDAANGGIYGEILHEVFKRTPHELKLVALPPARTRQKLASGIIDGECCPSRHWRVKEDLLGAVYSQSIFQTEDVLVFPAGAAITLPSAKKVPVGMVRGYRYQDADKWERVNMADEVSLLRALDRNLLKVGVLDSMSARHLSAKHGLEVSYGQVFEQATRPLRLRPEKAYLLPELNRAIEAAQRDGAIERILAKYRVGK